MELNIKYSQYVWIMPFRIGKPCRICASGCENSGRDYGVQVNYKEVLYDSLTNIKKKGMDVR